MNLLMVNDEILTAEAMKTDIAWNDYRIKEVTLAFNAIQAKAILEKQHIDVVLLDIEMPDENGIELLRWIRQKGFDVECLFLTCHARFEYAKEAVALGCQEYILMPVRYEEIGISVLKAVNRIISRRDASQLQEYGKLWVNNKKEEAQEFVRDKKTPVESVTDAVHFIMDNLQNEDLSVNKVAAHCYLTPIYMSRIFKNEKGISMSQFIIREKMMLAKRMLQETELSASVIAEALGYTSYPHFSVTFKKCYGCAPSQIEKS